MICLKITENDLYKESVIYFLSTGRIGLGSKKKINNLSLGEWVNSKGDDDISCLFFDYSKNVSMFMYVHYTKENGVVILQFT